jgi:hypothetical protein
MDGKSSLFLSGTYRSILLQCGTYPTVCLSIHYHVICFWKMFFVLYLGLFSFVLLFDYLPFRIYYEKTSVVKTFPLPVTEIVLHICTWSLIIEELRQVRRKDELFETNELSLLFLVWSNGTWIFFWHVEYDWCRCYYLISNFIYHTIHCGWNFFYDFEVRFKNNLTAISYLSSSIDRICLGIDLIIWFVGTLHLFAAFAKLGPKLVMIFNTVRSFFLLLANTDLILAYA